MTTIASYLGINAGSAEKEAEVAVASIRKAFFCVSNLQGVEYENSSGKLIQVPDSARHTADLTNFNFRSVVSTAVVDSRAPNEV